jgi:hypothetical protein
MAVWREAWIGLLLKVAGNRHANESRSVQPNIVTIAADAIGEERILPIHLSRGR